MAQYNTRSGRDIPEPPGPAAPLPVTAAWPVRTGSVPPLADRYTLRPETGPDLRAALGRSVVVALTPRSRRADALPGSDLLRCTGKTQIAVQYAESQWQSRAIELLIWIDASTRESILSGYADAAATLTGARLAGTAESIATSLLRWLSQTDRRWLVVLDDLPDASAVDGLWPLGTAGQLVVTTADPRAMTGLPDALVLEVGAFSLREAMSYLVSRLSLDPDQRRGAIALVEDLGCQPLALAQATATIGNSWLTCADYREQFYRRMTALAGPGSPPAAAGVTWTLSVDLAGQLVSVGAAQSSLAVAAFLDGHGIPAAVFETEAAHSYIAGGQEPAAQAAERVRAALTALEHSGLVLIDRQADPPLVRMNASLQRAVRQAMSPDLAERAGRAAAAALLEAWPPEPKDSPTAHAMRASATCLHHGTGELLWSDGCHPVLLRAGRSLDEARLTGPAVDYWAELAVVGNQVFGPAHPDSMVIVERLASAYVAAGRVSDAVAWYKRILADWSRTIGTDHPRTLTARVMLGRVLVSAGLYEDAISVLTSALTDAERAYGTGHPECSAIRDEVAAGYRAAGEFSEAIRLYNLILSERERRIGSQHPDTMAARQALAETFLADGRSKDAFSQYKKVVADRQRSQGRDHPDALRAAAALAAAYYQAGRMALAVQLYEQVYQGFERVLGPDDRDCLAAAVSLGRVYHAVGRLTDASELFRVAITRGERVLAPGDPLTRQARESLSAIVPD
jgi:tetratricopeptide (TPR) repeat protein